MGSCHHPWKGFHRLQETLDIHRISLDIETNQMIFGSENESKNASPMGWSRYRWKEPKLWSPAGTIEERSGSYGSPIDFDDCMMNIHHV